MNQQDLVQTLQKQNRLLKLALAMAGLGLLVAAASDKASFREIDVERINIVTADGKRELVIANRERLPGAVINGVEKPDHRKKAGLIFYNSMGDESGGLIWDGALDAKGNASQAMHFSMDRFGGDQQLALGSYEGGGGMKSGLQIYDRGLEKDYGPLWDAMEKAPEGPEKEALKQKWQAAGGQQTPRLFVGKTVGKSSALILSDAKGRARIMMYVTPEGKAVFNFLDEQGKVVQSLAPTEPSK